jgi:quinol monooxygenase YgiN
LRAILTAGAAARHAFRNRRQEEAMPVRLVISIDAAPGKGTELLKAMRERCEVSRKDAGCLQFDVFQSGDNPDKLALLELWQDQAALDAHAKLQAARPPLPEGLRLGAGSREDYTYNKTR